MALMNLAIVALLLFFLNWKLVTAACIKTDLLDIVTQRVYSRHFSLALHLVNEKLIT